MTKHETMLATKAEMIMMGKVMEVKEDDLTFLVEYILQALDEKDSTADEIVEAAHKFNSKNQPITHMVANNSGFGVLLTFVRDEEVTKSTDLTNEDGVLCYVYNLDYPDCSELGYSYFENKDNFYSRIA